MPFSLFFRFAKFFCASALVACLLPACAQQGPNQSSTPNAQQAEPAYKPDPAYTAEALAKRYPPQSIVSVDMANKALEDVKAGRLQAKEVFKQEEWACYQTFFATRCVDQAKARYQETLLTLRPIQVEADRYKRHQKVLKHERAIEERQAKKLSEKALKAKQAENKAAFEEKQRRRAAAQQRVREKRAKTEARRKEKAAAAAKRAKSRKAAMEQAGIASTSTSSKKAPDASAASTLSPGK